MQQTVVEQWCIQRASTNHRYDKNFNKIWLRYFICVHFWASKNEDTKIATDPGRKISSNRIF